MPTNHDAESVRLHTDIQMALDCDMASALVLTGESTLEYVAAQPEDTRPPGSWSE